VGGRVVHAQLKFLSCKTKIIKIGETIKSIFCFYNAGGK